MSSIKSFEFGYFKCQVDVQAAPQKSFRATVSAKSYDRLPNETNKAWAAFCIYRDMGLGRTVEKAAEIYYKPQENHDKATSISTTRLREWSSKNKWIDRCRDYDADRELERRAIKSDLDREAYIKDLESYQLQQKAIGTAAMSFTAKSLRAIDYALKPIYKAIEGRKDLTKAQIDILFSSQLAGKNAIAISTAGGELAAKGLAIEELMKQVQNEIDALES